MSEPVQAKVADRDLWRETPGDYYAPRLFLTEGGGIGMDVGGFVIVKPIREWHKLASQPSDVRAPSEECVPPGAGAWLPDTFVERAYRAALSHGNFDSEVKVTLSAFEASAIRQRSVVSRREP